MAVPVVVGLEAVEIHHQHRQLAGAAARVRIDAVDQLAEVALEGAVVPQPGERIGLGAVAQGLVRIGVVERDRRLGGEELDELEVAVAEVDLAAAHARHVQHAQDMAVGHQRDDGDRLGLRRRARDLERPGIVERVVGQDRLPVIDRPPHQAAAERDVVAADLLRMPLAGEHRDHLALRVIGPVDREVVVGHDVPEPVGDRLEDAGLVEGEEPLVDLEQPSLRVGASRQLGGLGHQLLVGLRVGHRLRGVAGEDPHRLEVVVGEAVEPELRQDDHAERLALVEHRDEEHRLGDVVGALDRLAARIVEGVVDEERLPVLRHPSGEALADGHPQERLGILGLPVEHLAREGDRIAHAALPVDAVDPDVVVVGQGAGLGHDRLADRPHVGQPVEARGEILDRPHARRAFGGRPVQASVLDGDRRLVGEGLDERDLVVRPRAVGVVVEADHPDRAAAVP